MSQDKNLAPAVAGTLTMTVDYASVHRRLEELRQFVASYLVPGEDYGIIEGIGKPTLLKSGAEKLCDVYGLAVGQPVIEYTRDDSKTPAYFSYRISLPLLSRADGTLIMWGVGSANSHEKKYKSRWVFANEVPSGIPLNTLKTKEGVSRKGNNYTQYLLPNEEIDDLDNTILKMAKKRAFVDAVLSATRSSSLFTQDIEDMDIKSKETPRFEQRQERSNNPKAQHTPSNANNNTNSNTNTNSNVSSNSGQQGATDAQQNAIRKSGAAKGLSQSEIEDIVLDQFGTAISELSKQDASNAIKLFNSMSGDELKSLIVSATSEEMVEIEDDELPF